MPEFNDPIARRPMKIRQCAGGIVTNADHEILVVTNDIGRHTFPKGRIRIKKGESPFDAAVREIYEESGLRALEFARPLGKLVRPGLTELGEDGPRVTKEIEMYHFRTDEIELRPVEDDIVVARWIAPEEVANVLSWQEEVTFFESHRGALGLG
jgi:8-oxo-dGTP pyrophosphatase MutT (NUDIX family)